MDSEQNTLESEMQTARIAVYDDLLSSPRIIDIPPSDIATYIGKIASTTYELASAQGGRVPFNVITQVAENFIHAHFREPTISILNNGNMIRFADHGPGISDKNRAQLPGFSSATAEMRQYINGVGSGLPIVKEYLKFTNGRLVIEDNIEEGTVVTITIEDAPSGEQPVIYKETANKSQDKPEEIDIDSLDLEERDLMVLDLAADYPQVGPTLLEQELGIATATGFRVLGKLKKLGLVEDTANRKKTLTDLGHKVVGR